MDSRVLFVDPASGTRGGDSFGQADALYANGVVLVRSVRLWVPPFSPSDVIDQVVNYAKAHRFAEIVGDAWSGQLVRELFLQRAITYRVCEWPKGELYLRFLPMINSGTVRLPDHPELLRQLRGLERRRGWGGKDRVDHRRGQHDDLANCVAGACVLAYEASRRPSVMLWGDGRPGPGADADDARHRQRDAREFTERIRAGGGAYLPGVDP